MIPEKRNTDYAEMPDLFPTLPVFAAGAHGDSIGAVSVTPCSTSRIIGPVLPGQRILGAGLNEFAVARLGWDPFRTEIEPLALHRPLAGSHI